MILLASILAILLAALLAVCWWGSNIIFHSPKMLDMSVWPEHYGLKGESVEFSTADGLRLRGWLLRAAEPTERCVLLLHGWGDNKGDLLRHTHHWNRKLNLFYIDFRHHGESEGPRSTIGCEESLDVSAAVDFLKKHRPAWADRLGVYGISMGGAMALWAAAEHPEIRCAAVEAPFSSFNEVVHRWCRLSLGLPYFPFVWLCLWIIRLRLGQNPDAYSPIHHAHRVAPRPLLFIAGAEDALMPLADVRRVFDRAGEPKELWVVDRAAHGKCEETAKESYHQKLMEFFEAHL